MFCHANILYKPSEWSLCLTVRICCLLCCMWSICQWWHAGDRSNRMRRWVWWLWSFQLMGWCAWQECHHRTNFSLLVTCRHYIHRSGNISGDILQKQMTMQTLWHSSNYAYDLRIYLALVCEILATATLRWQLYTKNSQLIAYSTANTHIKHIAVACMMQLWHHLMSKQSNS